MGLRLKKNLHHTQLILIIYLFFFFLRNTDVVYDPELVECLVKLLAKLLMIQKNPPEVYISSTIRDPGTYACFKNELGEFNVSIVSVL